MSITVLHEPRVTEQEQRDFRWLMDHLPDLTVRYPDKWVAVCNEEVAATAAGGEEASRLADR